MKATGMDADWGLLQERIRKLEMKATSDLRREFSRWLSTQSGISPMAKHKQTSKMAFLTGDLGKTLLWDLSVRGKLVFWIAHSDTEPRGEKFMPDKIKPWSKDGRGRHSHLNTHQSFFGMDACRFSCEGVGEARVLFHTMKLIR